MHGVRRRVQILNNPEAPLVLVGKRNDVGVVRERRVALADVLEGRLLPQDIDRRSINVPEDARDGLVNGDLHAEGGVIVGNELLLGGRDVDDGLERSGVILAERVGNRRAGVGGKSILVGAIVGQDGGRERVLGLSAEARLGQGRVDPVVSDGLVALDDDVVALTDAHEDVVNLVRLDRGEIGLDDLHLVADNGDSEGSVGRGIDESEPVALAFLQLDLGILAAGSAGVDVGAVEEDVAVRRG